MPGIIVGVDGSEHAQRALEWAMNEAAIRHAQLTVISVYPVIAGYFGEPLRSEADEPTLEKVRQATQDATERATGKLPGTTRPASVTVRAVAGYIADELISASRDTDLLVVGSRGAGGFARLLMGSVSSQVAHHAHCPVVIVPAEPKG